MGVSILEGDEGAVFYHDTSMEAFGPVMRDRQQAEEFVEWMEDEHGTGPSDAFWHQLAGGDLSLRDLYGEFLRRGNGS